MDEAQNKNEQVSEPISKGERRDIPYLPIGSVVLLKEGSKRVMVYGRRIKSRDDEKEYDYVGCPYPEGLMPGEDVIVFNHDQIQLVYFIGFQDLEEIVYRTQQL